MEFNRNRLLNNINNLIAKKKLKKNEVETNSGVSVGYLSRLAKPDNDSMPSVDFVWRVARELGVTMDALIDYDFTNHNEEQLLITNFIQELSRKTDEYELDWNRAINDDSLVFRITNGEYKCPLFIKNKAGEYCYKSKFFKYADIRLAGNCYDANLSPEERVYLMDVEGDFYNSADRFWEIYVIEHYIAEMTFADKYDIVPIITTRGVGRSLTPMIDDLANNIEKHENELKVSREALEVINRFMRRESNQRNK